MAHKDYTKAVEKAVDLPTVVAEYRTAMTALRRLYQVKPARNAGTTEKAIQRHYRAVRLAEFALVMSDNKELLGALGDEANLLVRLATAKNLGQDRPELKMRLSITRARIRSIAK